MSFGLRCVAAAAVVSATLAVGSMRVCGCRSEVASAIGALRAINSAQQSYAYACGAGGFAVDLEDLAAPPSEGASGFVSPDLSRNGAIKDGYAVTLMIGGTPEDRDAAVRTATCTGAKHAPAASYFASAAPLGDPTGRPFFATAARGVIYQSPKPIANPITPGPDVVVLH